MARDEMVEKDHYQANTKKNKGNPGVGQKKRRDK
jgi:hypothetical protein